MKKMKWVAWMLSIMMLFSLVGCNGATEPVEKVTPEETAYKVAVLLPGSINDGGWSTMGYESAKAAADAIGAEFSYTETKSPQDSIDALTDYGERGFNIVFCHSYDYQDACAKVAGDYPDTQFITSGGTTKTENITPIYMKSEQAAYLLGVMAAKMSTTKKVGVIGSEEIPSISKTLKGFAQGVSDTDPSVETRLTYLGTSTDVGKGREATIALINNGCDFIFASANAAAQGVFQAVDENKDKGIKGFGSYGRITLKYPETFVADMVSDYQPVFVEIAGKVTQKTFKPGVDYFADIFNKGCNVFFNETMKVPSEAMDAYNGAVEKFKTDSIKIDIGEY
ncbi:MAG: basic rane lipoprotein [Clostridiales bacterium]|jgi:basic membrane lipoprotein Med (substrate-binding protein (PBP1-ABC) superfamily)|nr:basic rane lipoprotein [Clostridiales bacterium]